jgi:hypothetical protein
MQPTTYHKTIEPYSTEPVEIVGLYHDHPARFPAKGLDDYMMKMEIS